MSKEKSKKITNNNKPRPKIALYAGSFDPFTLGHLDVAHRAAAIFDKVIIGIGNAAHKHYTFSPEERQKMANLACKSLPNVETAAFDRLSVDFAAEKGALYMVRGVRNELDYQFETQLAVTNRSLNDQIDMVFFPTKQELSHVSSTLIKEIAGYGGDLSKMLPASIIDIVKSRY